MDYIQQLNSADTQSDVGSAQSVPSQVSERPYSQQSSVHGSSTKDREDDDTSEASAGHAKPISKGDQAMINISACEFPEFAAYMSG